MYSVGCPKVARDPTCDLRRAPSCEAACMGVCTVSESRQYSTAWCVCVDMAWCVCVVSSHLPPQTTRGPQRASSRDVACTGACGMSKSHINSVGCQKIAFQKIAFSTTCDPQGTQLCDTAVTGVCRVSKSRKYSVAWCRVFFVLPYPTYLTYVYLYT